jgi:hypothetical protein
VCYDISLLTLVIIHINSIAFGHILQEQVEPVLSFYKEGGSLARSVCDQGGVGRGRRKDVLFQQERKAERIRPKALRLSGVKSSGFIPPRCTWTFQ